MGINQTKLQNNIKAIEHPMVSIIVITYNSSNYILDTLESTKAQTYQNIELILSDDCSTDDTVEICKSWLVENRERFVRTELITVEKNTGIPANCNRGVKVAQGEWIKFIAGDDILLENCILDNLSFSKINKNIKILFSTIILFKKEEDKIIYLGTSPSLPQKKMFELTAKQQYNTLLRSNWNWVTPSLFIQKRILEDLNFFDINYTLFEDYPLWIKATKNGIKLDFLDLNTVLYRQSQSVMRNTDLWINKKYFKSYLLFFNRHISKDLKRLDKKIYNLKKIFFFKIYILIFVFGNKKSKVSHLFNRIFNLFFKDPGL